MPDWAYDVEPWSMDCPNCGKEIGPHSGKVKCRRCGTMVNP